MLNLSLSYLQLLKEKDTLNICAPMVRYSKLPFRQVVRDFNVDLAFTPMILADVFCYSQFSKEIEYQTNTRDEPVVVQFAASNAMDLANASELVAKYCNGVDLNCGCPQKCLCFVNVLSF